MIYQIDQPRPQSLSLVSAINEREQDKEGSFAALAAEVGKLISDLGQLGIWAEWIVVAVGAADLRRRLAGVTQLSLQAEAGTDHDQALALGAAQAHGEQVIELPSARACQPALVLMLAQR